jgi:hypothetical protein
MMVAGTMVRVRTGAALDIAVATVMRIGERSVTEEEFRVMDTTGAYRVRIQRVHLAPPANFLKIVAPLPVRHAQKISALWDRTVGLARKGVLATLFVCRAPVRVWLVRPCSRVARQPAAAKVFSGLHPLGTHHKMTTVSGKPLRAISDSTTLSGRARLEPTRPRGDSARAYSVLLARSTRVKTLPAAPAA